MMQITFTLEACEVSLEIRSRQIFCAKSCETQLKRLAFWMLDTKRDSNITFDFLPLDFTAIVTRCPLNSTQSEKQSCTAFLRGPCSTSEVFYRTVRNTIEWSSNILDLLTEGAGLSVDFLYNFLSAGFRLGPYDRNLRFASPFSGISSVPTCTLLKFENGVTNYYRASGCNLSSSAFSDVREAKNLARLAIENHVASLVNEQVVAIETSGGIDSSLSLALALISNQARKVAGYAFNYPFHEFRYEELFRISLSQHFDTPVKELDDPHLLPYSQLSGIPSHSSPTWSAPDFGANSYLERQCKADHVTVLLSGHGADFFFLRDPNQSSEINWSATEDFSEFFRYRDINHLLRECAHRVEEETNQYCRHFGADSNWTLQGIEPTYLEFEQDNPFKFRGSPFLSREFLEPFHFLASNWKSKVGKIQKPLAHSVFEDSLPSFLWQRKSKIDHKGIKYRGLRSSRIEIINLLDEEGKLLEKIDINGGAVIDHLSAVCNGSADISPIFSGILSLCIWKRALGSMQSHT